MLIKAIKKSLYSGFLSDLLLLCSCDFLAPQKAFRIAEGKGDFTYNSIASHVKDLLEKNGYRITIVPTENAMGANAMVAHGDADLTCVMNSSAFVPGIVGQQSGTLRTILPLSTEYFSI